MTLHQELLNTTTFVSAALAVRLLCGHSLAAQVYIAAPNARISGEFEQLDPIRAVEASRNGKLSVVEFGATSIRLFDNTGKPLGKVGRRGAGPGEFRIIGRHGWLGDTLWVADNQQRRTSFFDQRLRHLGTTLWPARVSRKGTGAVSGTRAPYPWRYLSDGSQVLMVPYESEDAGRAQFPAGSTATLVRSDSSGRILNEIAAVGYASDDVCQAKWSTDAATGVIPVPFCPMTLYASSASGEWTVVVKQSIRGAGGTISIEVWSHTGRLLSGRSYNVSLDPLSASERSEAKRRLIRATPQDAPKASRDAIDQMQLPTYLPPVHAVAVLDDATVWLRRPTSGGKSRWFTLQPTPQAQLQELALPGGYEPRVRTLDGLWGLKVDEDDIPTIQLFVLKR